MFPWLEQGRWNTVYTCPWISPGLAHSRHFKYLLDEQMRGDRFPPAGSNFILLYIPCIWSVPFFILLTTFCPAFLLFKNRISSPPEGKHSGPNSTSFWVRSLLLPLTQGTTVIPKRNSQCQTSILLVFNCDLIHICGSCLFTRLMKPSSTVV